ncbi:hypothetical protein [Lacimicrobium sp. SS2-24]|uniref:hypothetical protein n=1 Tax=Lacimicrobium sp. SS2-24 TaxID=2005569 RepID=UPI000B4A8CE9|nr:hypothetical protein [Lacimicrobium sp. SS2-24]
MIRASFFALTLTALSATANAGLISLSLGDYDSGSVGPYPKPEVTIGTFNYDLAGQDIVSATLSGTYGSEIVPSSTAGFDLFGDGLLVAQCIYQDPGCWVSGDNFRPWSFDFSDFFVLSDGALEISVIQTSGSTIRLGSIELNIVTADIPVPAPLALIGLGLAGLGITRRGKTR